MSVRTPDLVHCCLVHLLVLGVGDVTKVDVDPDEILAAINKIQSKSVSSLTHSSLLCRNFSCFCR